MSKNKANTLFNKKNIILFIIGLALFVFFFSFHVVSFESGIMLETAYGFGAFFAVLLGPIFGFLIGIIGHSISDFIVYGEISIGWVLASGLSLLLIGAFGTKLKIETENFGFKKIIAFIVIESLAFFLSFYIVTTFFDVIVFGNDPALIYEQAGIAAIYNSITTAILGSVAIKLYNFYKIGGSLNDESK